MNYPRNERVLAFIVVVIGLCWLASMSLGLAGGPSFEGRLDLNASGLEQLRGRLTARLPAGDLRLAPTDQAGCGLDSTTLTVSKSITCTYDIQADPGKTRRLTLSLGGDGRSVELELTQPGALSVTQTLTAGQSVDLDVYKDDSNQGAKLFIRKCDVPETEKTPDPGRLYVCVLEIEK